jgi:hypothetical protein
MDNDDRINDDATDEVTDGIGRIEEGGTGPTASGAEAAGNDPAGLEPSEVGDSRRDEGGGQPTRAGDWNPGEQSGGGEHN